MVTGVPLHNATAAKQLRGTTKWSEMLWAHALVMPSLTTRSPNPAYSCGYPSKSSQKWPRKSRAKTSRLMCQLKVKTSRGHSTQVSFQLVCPGVTMARGGVRLQLPNICKTSNVSFTGTDEFGPSTQLNSDCLQGMQSGLGCCVHLC